MNFEDFYLLSAEVNPSWQAIFGICLENGWGTKIDRSKALLIYLAGLENNDPLSKLCLADYYAEHSENAEEKIAAFDIYKEFAEAKNKYSCYKLALCYQFGFGTQKNEVLAEQYATIAANFGYPPAMEMLGLLYLDGVNGHKNINDARKWLEFAANAGCSTATFQLAHLHETGDNTLKNPLKAFELYQAASNLGNWSAHGRLAIAYKFGQLGQKIDTERAAFHEKRAQIGELK